jgi:hypothetical protein
MNTWEENMALVRPIWNILESVYGITSDQIGWDVLYTLMEGPYPDLTPEQITPQIVGEGMLLIAHTTTPEAKAPDAS